MTFGSLFAGIGGLDLGLERAGLECRWQVEIDDYARRVLAKHWPDVRRWDDVRTFPPDPVEDWSVDLICGGFPCQDISHVGRRAGIDGERSGLWSEFERTVRLLRPRYVLVENVPSLLVRGMGRVLGNLASLGFDAEWAVLPASRFGAPHFRERIFILAYSDGFGCQTISDEARLRLPSLHKGIAGHVGPMGGAEQWSLPRPIGAIPMGVGNGIPSGLDRIRTLGNAVVPQVAEWLGLRIIEFDRVLCTAGGRS
jgi:DNA (cytosine-5)-methyltransferase 1